MSLLLAPSTPEDRLDVFRFFDGAYENIVDEDKTGRPRTPFVKTFLLEHVSSKNGHTPKGPDDIFKKLGAEPKSIDQDFWEIRDSLTVSKDQSERIPVGYVERYDERFFAYYTVETSQDAQKRVKRWVRDSFELDHTWFSSEVLQSLWSNDVSKRGDNRFGQLAFLYEGIFELWNDENLVAEESEESQGVEEEDSEQDIEQDWLSEDVIEPTRRKARFKMADRIGEINRALSKLQESYSPLHALYSIRIPSMEGSGGHDLFQEGRLTCRGSSFLDHRNTVRYLYRAYKSALERTEAAAWAARPDNIADSVSNQNVSTGVPLIVKFDQPLTKQTFERWIKLAFRKNNPFRLWGEPLRMGPTKVQVYGADRHLWQPINLEITEKHLIAVLPKGTCGNTFHRLVTNIQRYVSPKIDAWLGNKKFNELTPFNDTST